MTHAVYASLESMDYGSDADAWAQEVLSLCQERAATVVAANLVWEKRSFLNDRSPVIAHAISRLRNQGIMVILVLDYNYSHLDLAWTGADDVVFLHYSLWRCYNWLVRTPISPRNRQWNPDATKLLFMTGKPDKPQRVRLLWKLYRGGLLDGNLWSFFGQGAPFDRIHAQIPEESAEDLRALMSQWERNLDHTRIEYRGQSMHGWPIPVDPDLFYQSRFRIISETDHEYNRAYPYPWITEKTWITLLNNVPWMIAGEPNSCQWMEQLGFDSFQWALVQPYDHVTDTEQRLDLIVTNSRHWLSEGFDRARMAQAVDRNWHTARAMAREIQRSLQSVLARYDIEGDVEDLCPTLNKVRK